MSVPVCRVCHEPKAGHDADRANVCFKRLLNMYEPAHILSSMELVITLTVSLMIALAAFFFLFG